MRSNSLETEAALIIYSENPQLVARQIAGLTSIADYRLLPQDFQAIHDFYLDTPDWALQAQKLALRLRKIGSTRLLTLKGPSQLTDGGGVNRLEIERPWSEDTLNKIIKELMDRRLKIPHQHQDFDYAHPLSVMSSLGLEVVQDRETRRQVRNIVTRGKKSSPILAEMAIDAVVYHFNNHEICLHEVEIEAKVEDSSRVLKDVIENLVAMYGPVLRRWDHSKIATGKAIEKLLSEGVLKGLLDIKNNLKPVAYDKIDEYLKRGSI